VPPAGAVVRLQSSTPQRPLCRANCWAVCRVPGPARAAWQTTKSNQAVSRSFGNRICASVHTSVVRNDCWACHRGAKDLLHPSLAIGQRF